MIKNLIIGTLAAILITAIGFSVYNVLAPGAAQGAAPLREVVAQQNQTGVQAQDQTQAAEPVAQADAGALPQTAAALPQTAAQANVVCDATMCRDEDRLHAQPWSAPFWSETNGRPDRRGESSTARELFKRFRRTAHALREKLHCLRR